MPTYQVRCHNCGEFEIEKRMTEPLPRCPDCAGELKQVYLAPAVQFNAPGFYATDDARFDQMVGPERAARVKRQNEAALKRKMAGRQTDYERALEAIPS